MESATPPRVRAFLRRGFLALGAGVGWLTLSAAGASAEEVRVVQAVPSSTVAEAAFSAVGLSAGTMIQLPRADDPVPSGSTAPEDPATVVPAPDPYPEALLPSASPPPAPVTDEGPVPDAEPAPLPPPAPAPPAVDLDPVAAVTEPLPLAPPAPIPEPSPVPVTAVPSDPAPPSVPAPSVPAEPAVGADDPAAPGEAVPSATDSSPPPPASDPSPPLNGPAPAPVAVPGTVPVAVPDPAPLAPPGAPASGTLPPVLPVPLLPPATPASSGPPQAGHGAVAGTPTPGPGRSSSSDRAPARDAAAAVQALRGYLPAALGPSFGAFAPGLSTSTQQPQVPGSLPAFPATVPVRGGTGPGGTGNPAAPAGGNDSPPPLGGDTGLPAPSALPPGPGSGSGSGSTTGGAAGAAAWAPANYLFIPLMGTDPISGPLQRVHSAASADPGSSPD